VLRIFMAQKIHRLGRFWTALSSTQTNTPPRRHTPRMDKYVWRESTSTKLPFWNRYWDDLLTRISILGRVWTFVVLRH
jgi:hypothetical protein